jgi:hypothetical protein
MSCVIFVIMTLVKLAVLVIQFQDGTVKFQHFSELHRLDNVHGGLRAAPKLTEAHINPNNLQRMNVRLAVQVSCA